MADIVRDIPGTKLVLWGAGSQSKVLAQIIGESQGSVVALFSDAHDVQSELPQVICGSANVEAWVKANPAIDGFGVAIGGANGRARLEKLRYLSGLGLIPKTLVHSTATVLPSRMGQACQLLARSFLGLNATLGDAVILNSCSAVDHECAIGDGVHVGPGAVLAGRVTVGDRTFIGTGARVCPDITIAPDCVIGAGAVVVCDIPEAGTYVGVPARRLN